MPSSKSHHDIPTRRWRNLPELWLILWAAPLHGAWEFSHSPLYTDHSKGWWYIVWTRLHCTVGDLMILLACFLITSLLFCSRTWLQTLKRPAVIVFVVLGISFTIFSEWYNTSATESWQYTEAMPTLWGIGLSPILQWIVIPPTVVIAVHRMTRVT